MRSGLGKVGVLIKYHHKNNPFKVTDKATLFRSGFLIKRTHKMKKGRLFSLVLLISVLSISMAGFPLTAQSQVTLNIEDSSGYSRLI